MTSRGVTVLAVLAILGCGRSQTRGASVADSAAAAAPVAPTPTVDTSRKERPPAVSNAPKTIDAVLAEHNDSLMAVPGVLGTAVGRCKGAPCIRVLVGRVSDEIRRRVPPTLEGYPVHIDVTGTIVPR